MQRISSRNEKQVLKSTASRVICRALYGWCVILGTLTSTQLFAQAEPANTTTTFLVVRHAERDGNLDKLTKTGEQRAQALASVGSALNVKAIYSTNTKRTKGTVQPLATAANIEIQTYGRTNKDWIASLKQKHSGKVVLIVGHSNTTGLIAGLLAEEKPIELDHDEYDALFIVQVTKSETRSLRLRYGNSSEGAASADPDKMGLLESTRRTKAFAEY